MNCSHYVDENTRWTGAVLKKCVVCNRRRLYTIKVVRCSACSAFVHKRCLSGKNNDEIVFSAADAADEVIDVLETTKVEETVPTAAVNAENDRDQVSPEDGDQDSIGIDASSQTTVGQIIVENHVTDGEFVAAAEESQELPSKPKCLTDEIPDEMAGTVRKTCGKNHDDGGASSSSPNTGTSGRKSAAAKRRARKKATAAKMATHPPVPVDHLVSTTATTCRVTDKIASHSPAVTGVDRISSPSAGPAADMTDHEIPPELNASAVTDQNDALVAAVIADDGSIGGGTAIDAPPSVSDVTGQKSAWEKADDDVFIERLLSSTNPWTSELKELKVFGYFPTLSYVDFVDNIGVEEGFAVTYGIAESEIPGQELVKLIVRPDVIYLGSGDTFEAAQEMAAFSFIMAMHIEFKK